MNENTEKAPAVSLKESEELTHAAVAAYGNHPVDKFLADSLRLAERIHEHKLAGESQNRSACMNANFLPSEHPLTAAEFKRERALHAYARSLKLQPQPERRVSDMTIKEFERIAEQHSRLIPADVPLEGALFGLLTLVTLALARRSVRFFRSTCALTVTVVSPFSTRGDPTMSYLVTIASEPVRICSRMI